MAVFSLRYNIKIYNCNNKLEVEMNYFYFWRLFLELKQPYAEFRKAILGVYINTASLLGV